MLKFLVTGTIRSGTAYTAQVLNRAGIACGHGWVYPPDGVRRYPHVEVLGDAAPLAVPFVADFQGLVLHQVRHPLKVIGSLLGFAGGGIRWRTAPKASSCAPVRRPRRSACRRDALLRRVELPMRTAQRLSPLPG